MTPEQCRAGRALVGVSQTELAREAKVGRRTLADFENGVRRPYDRTLRDIQETLEAYGVTFLDRNGGGPGVRLRDSDAGS
jgi:transcriptional regulator with XRE-family HTH domain